MRRLIYLMALTCCCLVGCTVFDRLQPHQLWKLNRQAAPSGESADSYFSIPATPKSGVQ